jgi:fluoride ion exporter CrcB/FEX
MTSWLTLLLVGTAGGVGTVLRVLLLERTPGFRTLLKINIASSFLITLVNLLLHALKNLHLEEVLRPMLCAGLMGGFSSLSALVVSCIKEKELLKKNLLTIFWTVLATAVAAGVVMLSTQ